MVKIYREFFDGGGLKRELYYDSDTMIVSEIKKYNADGSLIFSGRMEHETTLDAALKTVKFTDLATDPSFLDEEAIRDEESREAVERSRERREALERQIEERRRSEREAEARLKLAERYIGRTLGDNDLA